MQRYIERKWYGNVLKGAGNPTNTSSLSEYVNKDKDVRPARLLQMYAGLYGLIMVLFGLLLIIFELMGMEEATLKLLSVFPIILGGGLYAFHKMKHPDNGAMRELSTSFLAITFTISALTIPVAFQMDLDQDQYRYVFYICLAATLALTFMNKSSLTAYVMLSFLWLWAFAGFFIGMILENTLGSLGRGIGGDLLGSGIETSILFWAFFGGVVKFLMDNTKEGVNLKTVILGWMVAPLAVAGGAAMTGGQALIGVSGVVFALYVFGKKFYAEGSAFWNRPFQTTAFLGLITLVLMCSNGDVLTGLLMMSGMYGEPGGEQIVGLLVSLGLTGATGYYYFKNHYQTNNRLNITITVIPMLAIVAFLFGFSEERDTIALAGHLYTLGGILIFGFWLKEGLKSKYPPVTFLGLITLLMLFSIKSQDLAGVESPGKMGMIYLLLGLGLLYFTFLVDKNWGLNNFNNILPEKLMDQVIDSNDKSSAGTPPSNSADSEPKDDNPPIV